MTTTTDHPADGPQIDPRDALVAVLMLDTRVNGRYIPRDTFKRVGPPKATLTARRVAARLSEAVGQPITADDIFAAHKVLRSSVPTFTLREIAEAHPDHPSNR